ncbi:MAG: hypothetical protein Q4Q62_08500, partial [Thermoplasmata archaeon]|nr:hypothetical protein [Thermoplasmata archaeon]
MGALDKRVYFSYAAFASALLFIVAGVLLYTSGASDPAADANNIGLTVTAIAGILAFIFSFPHTTRDNSFVRQISASLLMVSGVVFAISAIYDGSEWIFATAGVLAGAAIVVDMLALWVSRVYGAMYVSAVLGAVVLVMGIMSFVNGYTPGYTLAMFLAFGIWLVMSGWVLGFTESDDGSRIREVVEAAVSEKKEKPQAQNKKATPKAKKAEPKKADDAEEKKVRTVELPDTAASKEAVQKTQQPAPKAEEAPAEEPKEEPKAEPQKPPAKAMGDFMQKLMSS